MDALTYLRNTLVQSRSILEGTMEGVTPELAHWQPAGKALPIGAQYAHVVIAEDYFVNKLIKGGDMLAATTWADRTGLSAPPPVGDYSSWARGVQIDLPALRAYAQAVHAATDALLTSLTVEDLDRKVDAPSFGQDATVATILGVVSSHPGLHAGEISCIKGLNGLKGYSF